MNIRVADKNTGEIIINSNRKLEKVEEYAVKSLCMLQLMCLNEGSSNAKFPEFIKILKDTTTKLENLYKDETDEPDPFEQFDSSIN